MADPSHRLDAFTDAAFAFAVTLMVAGAGGTTLDYAQLQTAMASIPSFAIGFAIMGMFWYAHVRWRSVRGMGYWRSVLLTFALVFIVLVYVAPLRAMAASLAAFIVGESDNFGGKLGPLFVIYGLGFVGMSTVVALLFHDALRNPMHDAKARHNLIGEIWIWIILAATGAVSTILAMIPATVPFAPWAYATLPVSNGLFGSRWKWAGPEPDTA